MPLVTLLLVLFGCLAVATPFLTLYLLVKHGKLRDQFEHFKSDSSRQRSALQREIAELNRQVAGLAPAKQTPEKHAAPDAMPAVSPAIPMQQMQRPAPPAPSVHIPPAQDVSPTPRKIELPPAVKFPPTAKPESGLPAASTTPAETQSPEPTISRLRPATPAEAPLPAAVRISTPAPTFAYAGSAPKPTLQQRMKKVSSIEETLGTNWLQKLGIILLVMGVAMFGILELRTLGAAGKVAISFLAAVALLGGGLFLERRERYRLLGRTLIGGGWSLLFFSVFGMYHVEAMQVLGQTTSNLMLDCTLMLGVAIAMALHTLRYKSQFVTGLAFLLGYTTVALSQDSVNHLSQHNVYSLSAGVILAIGLVAIVLRMGWFELEVFGILSSYLNHLYWLYRILGPNGAEHHPFAAYHASVGMLFFYWLIFRISYVARGIKTEAEEHVSTAAAILNMFLLLGVMKFQSVQPELAYLALLTIGALEFAFGQLPITKRRREAFIVLSVAGAALMLAAAPSHYSGNNVAILWLVGAEVFLAAGIVVKEPVFRRLGLGTGLLVVAHLAIVDFRELISFRENSEALLLSAGVLFSLCAAVFYSNALVVASHWKEFCDDSPERPMLIAQSYAAAFAAGAAVWALFARDWTAIALGVVVLALAELAKRSKDLHLQVQYSVLGLLALCRVVFFNLHLETTGGQHVRMRLITLPLLSAIFYVVAKLAPLNDTSGQRVMRSVFSCAGTALLAALIWCETPMSWAAAAWAVFALILAMIDRRFELDELRWQAHALAALAMVRCIAVNLYVNELWHGLSVRLLSIAVVAVIFYGLAVIVRMPRELRDRDFQQIYSWAASTLASLLIWYELQQRPLGIAVAWAAFGLVLFEYGLMRKIAQFRFQAYVVLVAAFSRIFFANLAADPAGEFWGSRTFTVLPLALIFFFIYAQLPVEQSEENKTKSHPRFSVESLLAYLGTSTVVALCYFQFPLEWVVTSYAALAFLLLGIALLLDRPLFLHQGMLLTLGVFARGMAHNLFGGGYYAEGNWQGRYVVLGSAVAILLASLFFAFRLRGRYAPSPDTNSSIRPFLLAASRPEQLQFFVPITLLTFMLAMKLRAGMVTVAWGFEAVFVIILALVVKERSFRLTGLAMLLLCVGKVVVMDAWGLEPRDRYITFIIVGAALVFVSYLYTRYSETIRQYL